MGLYEYESRRNDLETKYGQDNAVNQYARFAAQRDFGRREQDFSQSFQRGFPKFTGGWAKRQGSNVQSGRFGRDLSEMTGDFNQQLGRMREDQASWLGNWESQRAAREAAYRRELMLLDESNGVDRARFDPYAQYRTGGL